MDQSQDEKGHATLPLEWTNLQRCRDPSCRRAHMIAQINSTEWKNVTGQAIFCLHESNPSWFQGYLVPNTEERPLRLVVVQQDIDECLQCQLGGYRVVELRIYDCDNEETVLQDIDWTGGDMMVLHSPQVSMQTTRLVTDHAAGALMRRLFDRLIREVQTDENDSILDLFPYLAIVMGPIELQLPLVTKKVSNSKPISDKAIHSNNS